MSLDEAHLKIVRDIREYLKAISDRADNLSSMLIIEQRVDGGWYISRVNCPVMTELGLAEAALENAKERFRTDRMEGLVTTETPK